MDTVPLLVLECHHDFQTMAQAWMALSIAIKPMAPKSKVLLKSTFVNSQRSFVRSIAGTNPTWTRGCLQSLVQWMSTYFPGEMSVFLLHLGVLPQPSQEMLHFMMCTTCYISEMWEHWIPTVTWPGGFRRSEHCLIRTDYSMFRNLATYLLRSQQKSNYICLQLSQNQKESLKSSTSNLLNQHKP